MDKFIKKNIFQRMKMSISELEDYYKNLRRYQFEQRQPLKGIQLRKYTLGLYAMLLKLDRILSHEKISLLKNESVKTKRPVVFAVTHVGGFDVARVYELLRPKAYMLFGDPGDIYKSLWAFGVFDWLDPIRHQRQNREGDRDIPCRGTAVKRWERADFSRGGMELLR